MAAELPPPSIRPQQAALSRARQRQLLPGRSAAALRGRTAERVAPARPPECSSRRRSRKLFEKCRAGKAIGFGDNMAFVGVLSTMLRARAVHPARRRAGDGGLTPCCCTTLSSERRRRAPSKTALVDGGRRVAYGELLRADPRAGARTAPRRRRGRATGCSCSSKAASSTPWPCTPCSWPAASSCRFIRWPRRSGSPSSRPTRGRRRS